MKRPKPMPKKTTSPTAEKSAMMRKVRTALTAPERAVIRALAKIGIRPRLLNYHRLPGKPDIVFMRERLAVFVDGEFWHGMRPVPKTNAEWWKEKFKRNKARDRRVERLLRSMGFSVIRIRESIAIRYPARCADRVRKTRNARKRKA